MARAAQTLVALQVASACVPHVALPSNARQGSSLSGELQAWRRTDVLSANGRKRKLIKGPVRASPVRLLVLKAHEEGACQNS